MTRALSLASLLAVTLSIPAFAADDKVAAANEDASAINTAVLNFQANANQAAKLLATQGYTQISIMGRDDDGRWTGVASKDGKLRLVAVDLRRAQPEPATN